MIEGSCHCGAVGWRLEGVPDSATACNCTVCRRYGVLWAYDYEDEGIRVSGLTHAYTWGSRTIEFHFCPNCGCVAYWRAGAPGKDGRRRIAARTRAIGRLDPVAERDQQCHQDGMVPTARLSARPDP